MEGDSLTAGFTHLLGEISESDPDFEVLRRLLFMLHRLIFFGFPIVWSGPSGLGDREGEEVLALRRSSTEWDKFRFALSKASSMLPLDDANFFCELGSLPVPGERGDEEFELRIEASVRGEELGEFDRFKAGEPGAVPPFGEVFFLSWPIPPLTFAPDSSAEFEDPTLDDEFL